MYIYICIVNIYVYMFCQKYLNVKKYKIEYLNITSGWFRVCHIKVLHIKSEY